jgi:hypothetical protein
MHVETHDSIDLLDASQVVSNHIQAKQHVK